MAGGAIVLRRKFSASAFWDDARKYRACFRLPKPGARADTTARARQHPRKSASGIDCIVISRRHRIHLHRRVVPLSLRSAALAQGQPTPHSLHDRYAIVTYFLLLEVFGAYYLLAWLLACGYTALSGNGLRGDIWDGFRKRFGIATILEFYGATEGNIGLLNYNGRVLSPSLCACACACAVAR
jgi:hypothetical protein